MKSRPVIGFMSVFFLMGCLSDILKASEFHLPQIPGISKQTLNLPDGTLLRYTLSIPKEFSYQKEIPLVMALHYGGTVTPWYSYDFTALFVEPALRSLKAVIAAPDCPGKGWDNPGSESAVMTLLDSLKENYRIDPKRILLTGYSMGGIGTWYLAAKHPETFTAAIPISGMTTPDVLSTMGNTLLYVIHSNKDEIFPILSVKEIVQRLEKRNIPVQLVILNGINHYDTSRFVEPLRASIPWLKKAWDKQN